MEETSLHQYRSIKTDVLAKLERELPTLREKFGVETVGIFGSVSRGEDTPESDIDILYLFSDNRGDLFEYLGFAAYLETLLGRKVELVSLEFIDPWIKPHIQKDAILYGAKAAVT